MEPILGQIQIFAFNYAPDGWTLCDGRQLQVAQNQALFSLISNTYGGDGRTTFNLPDLRNAAPFPSTNPSAPNCAYYIATMGIYPPRP
ncbi:tail fiber protein [Heliobacillus mobilis]|uniref:Tail fiber protein n=1 Tax=Heliobacterium mobile TaxID=28064 RepID=A0A6I3SN37_HELMO|nr:phage tail protein [Heliobacterium mobile]MTV50430.1 tail fiber protein [Heliobacterium mobile]